MNFLIYTVVESVRDAREKQEGVADSGAQRGNWPQPWGTLGLLKATLKRGVPVYSGFLVLKEGLGRSLTALDAGQIEV